jgi:hypothetical protein
MAFRIRYRPLCAVSFRHGYHLNRGGDEFDDLMESEQRRKLSAYNIFQDLRLEVPSDTRRTLAAHGLLLKPTATGIEIGASAERPSSGFFVPSVMPLSAYRLRFVLRVRDPLFWDYTNLELGVSERAPRGRSIYYLSNRAGTLGGSFPSLSAPPPVYTTGTVYRAGDVVRTSPDSTKRFLAVRAGTHPAPAGDDGTWLRIGPPDHASGDPPDKTRNYVGTTDLATLYPPIFSLPFSPATVTTASAELIGPEGSVQPIGAAAAPSGGTLDRLLVDARASATGQYRLRVIGRDTSGNDFDQSQNVYLDAQLRASGVFAIVELFHEPWKADDTHDPLGDFRLYEQSEDGISLRDWAQEPNGERQFKVNLLNRHTFWRYHFGGFQTITDFGDLEPMDGDDTNPVLVTKRVMPLTRGVARVEFAGGTLLPNPPGGPVVPEADRVYSDIYVQTK